MVNINCLACSDPYLDPQVSQIILGEEQYKQSSEECNEKTKQADTLARSARVKLEISKGMGKLVYWAARVPMVLALSRLDIFPPGLLQSFL
jgi:hypothetical protein